MNGYGPAYPSFDTVSRAPAGPPGPHHEPPRDTAHTRESHDRQGMGTLSPACTECQELITAFSGYSLSRVKAAVALAEAFRDQYVQPNGTLVLRRNPRTPVQHALLKYEETR